MNRRIAIVIGNWVSVKASRTIRGDIYSVLLSLMGNSDTTTNNNNDLVVRLTAVIHMKTCVDEWDFDSNQFMPYFEPSLSLFTSLLHQLEEFDSKIKVLNCLSVIVERLETRVLPFAQSVVGLLPGLWADSEGQNLFRCYIFVILKSLVSVSVVGFTGLGGNKRERCLIFSIHTVSS